jgi:hypothetical protein
VAAQLALQLRYSVGWPAVRERRGSREVADAGPQLDFLPSNSKELRRWVPFEEAPVIECRDLVRNDQDRQSESDLESLLLAGLRSGDAKPLGRADFNRARAFVRELAAKKRPKGK